MLKASELRQGFLNFFKDRSHTIVASMPVIPHDDPTLLFTNAGMNQFKETLLGKEKRDYYRACSVQKCIRAGGKHNDLEHVGHDSRHCTFFEMLGNWSFGDYYKQDAIIWAWEYVINHLKLDRNKLYVTIDVADKESLNAWKNEIGLKKDRIIALGNAKEGNEENFWSMGPIGPCGYCTEIYYDMGESFSCGSKDCAPGCDCDRYTEIWNLVFMEFNRDEEQNLSPLPMKSVDTGMGLERVLAILQEKESIFETDAFYPIIQKTEVLLGQKYDRKENKPSFNTIADHIRSVSFALADGAVFANDGRGYVIRRILRRAIRHGHLLGAREPFIHRLVDTLADIMGNTYPELEKGCDHIIESIKIEEEKFFKTLDRGINLFNEEKEKLILSGKKCFSGEFVFKLYDTFGFPPDLTEIMAKEASLEIENDEFKEHMSKQKKKASDSAKFYANNETQTLDWVELCKTGETTIFTGTFSFEEDARILKFAKVKDSVFIVLDKTPFYAESGGQIGDSGCIKNDDFEIRISDTKKISNDYVHIGIMLTGDLTKNSIPFINAAIDLSRRENIMRNHTATHLLHNALRKALGQHVMQSGSRVDPSKLRFDFNYNKALSSDKLEQIETLVNTAILDNYKVDIHEEIELEQAKKDGAIAIFGEKYQEKVRIVDIGEDSKELCGGTHVSRTGDIGLFKIIEESSVAAGVRRIEAITGPKALEDYQDKQTLLSNIIEALDTSPESIICKISDMKDKIKELEAEIKELKNASIKNNLDDFLKDSVEINGLKLIKAKLSDADNQEMLSCLDQLKNKEANSVSLIISIFPNRTMVVIGITKEAIDTHNLHAGNIMKELSKSLPFSGGGKENTAQGSLKDPTKADDLFNLLMENLKDKLA
ncbi:MAG: alanine--tRNA ligase [Pseudomonadota bacterium]